MDKENVAVELLQQKFKYLKLPQMAACVAQLLEQAAQENLPAYEVISRLCDEEKAGRNDRSVKRRIHEARFPQINTVDAFDFNFSDCRKKMQTRYLALFDLNFLHHGTNILFLGCPGSGKTFLARALAFAACQKCKRVLVASASKMLNELAGENLYDKSRRVFNRYVKTDLLLIDDFATHALNPEQAKDAFAIISERYDYRRSSIITTNRSFKDWAKVFPDELDAQVIADRLIERCEVFILEKGYRTKNLLTK